MRQLFRNDDKKFLVELCAEAKRFVGENRLEECERLVRNAMAEFPDAAEPHNLFGIVLIREGDPVRAMKHFRAACDLDPAFVPARVNLERFGEFRPSGSCAFCDEDCPKEIKKDKYKVEYDDNGIGHIVRRLRYDN